MLDLRKDPHHHPPLNYWTVSALECHERGSDCTSCPIKRDYPDLVCQMGQTVEKLFKKLGPPESINKLLARKKESSGAVTTLLTESKELQALTSKQWAEIVNSSERHVRQCLNALSEFRQFKCASPGSRKRVILYQKIKG